MSGNDNYPAQSETYRLSDGSVKRLIQDVLGHSGSTAVTDPAATAVLIAVIKGVLKQLQGTGTGGAPVSTLGTGISVAATPTAATAVAADVNALVAAVAGLRLVGFSVKETAGAAAVLNIVHGATGAGGANIYPITLAANESTGDWFGPDGIAVASGLSIDWVSGAATIVLYHKAVV